MKTCVFTHWDLDGVTSYLVLTWALGQSLPYVATTSQRFRTDFTNWLISNNIEDYDKIYITDLDVSEHKDLIDKKNMFIIDHHSSHKPEYKNAIAVVKDYPSAAELIYKIFKKLNNLVLNDAQKKMIILTSDYDSYTLDIPDSHKLNTLFWNVNKAFDTFVKTFAKGFYGFSLEHENVIKFYNNKIEQIKQNLQVYAGKFKIQDKERYVCATFTEKNINDVSDVLLKDFKADISIVVNTKENHVSFRRAKEINDVNLAKLAEKLGSPGATGGHEYAAGCSITKTFMEFTKALKQIK